MAFKLLLITTLLTLGLSQSILSQDIPENNILTEQIWLDYNPSYKLNEAINLYGDIGARVV